MIGHEHVDAAGVGRRDAVDAGDPVVDRDQEIGLAAGGQLDDLGREPVAVFEPIGHEVVDLRAEHAQPAHGDRAGRGAVAVVIGDDEQALALRDGVCEQVGCFVRALQFDGRHEPRQRGFDLVGHAHAARGVQARENRVQAVADQRGFIGGRARAGDDSSHGEEKGSFEQRREHAAAPKLAQIAARGGQCDRARVAGER
jgi:hypothetical protein